MTPEEKRLLERTFELVEENNKLLRKLDTVRKWAIAWRVFYWTAIIALSFGAYYLIQPYVDMVSGALPDMTEALDNFKSLTE